MPTISEYLIAPFRTVTRTQIFLWIVAAGMITTLDYMGMWEIDRIESFPGEVMPPSEGTLFDFFAGIAGLLVTIPMLTAKGCIGYLVFYGFGIDLFKRSFGGDPASIAFDFCFDLFVCFVFFVVWRIANHYWKAWRPKTPPSSCHVFLPEKKFR